jgi:cysteine synthase
MNTPKTYRKRPVEIQAVRWDGSVSSAHQIISWIGMSGGVAFRRPSQPYVMGVQPAQSAYIDIHTLEGVMSANPGDYIIRGIQGEFYPCKPGIFEATYEPAEVTE